MPISKDRGKTGALIKLLSPPGGGSRHQQLQNIVGTLPEEAGQQSPVQDLLGP